MAAPNIAYNITPIPMGKSNAYLVSAPDLVILIDTGCSKNLKPLEQVLRQKELQITDINYIVVTHAHYDHVGHLAEIREKSGAKVLAHRDAVDYLKNGHTPFPKGTMLLFKIISNAGNRFFSVGGKFTPVKPDILIEGDYDLLKSELTIRIIHTPGHTSGSVCLIINDESAIVGDTLFNVLPETVYPPFANDENELIKSWEKLLATGCSVFYPGHGKPFSRDKFRKCFEKKKK
ncbi:MBL fold metallo-hydrolase [Methanolobus sp. WCC1]|jgi:glyoxylase-like metal-dependent hydrolase (beta-lactamase superfamily II)|uniref:MBL fold metallo-hydrolase n=1 Tax=unclassified Methanolobus TaxID=2629569 RepID=UPI0024AB638E|nr:MBL fold metallo-hydrolase [Methanolobus sp.]MDI3485234.1 hydroxyacylglutathione hydrolase [Methanolobus sp.]MDK2831103.1 hydroxyacylglutathione hydrolase [Methanolobus sp.]